MMMDEERRTDGLPDEPVAHWRAPADLRDRIEVLADRDDRSAEEAVHYLRYLYELQDMPRFQAEMRGFAARVAAGLVQEISAFNAELTLRLADLAVLPVEEVEAMLAALQARAGRDAVVTGSVSAGRARLKVRRLLAARYEGEFTLISLGLHCLPWLLPNRWGLRSPAMIVRGLNPFALAKHRYNALVDDLANDFEAYAPSAELMSVTTPSRLTIAARRDRGAVWNHHKGEFWSQEGFAELLRSIAGGLDVLRREAAGPGPVFLMGDVPFRYPEQPIRRLDEVHTALDRLSGGRHRLLLASQRSTGQARTMHKVDDRTTFLDVPYPDRAYSWADRATINSPTGLRYERGYVGLIYRALLDWGLLRRRGRES